MTEKSMCRLTDWPLDVRQVCWSVERMRKMTGRRRRQTIQRLTCKTCRQRTNI